MLTITIDPTSVAAAPLWRPPVVVSAEEAQTTALGDAIAELASRIHAATYELLVLIRQFDACAGWSNGCLSCAHWLNWRTGLDLGAAREKVRVARALADLPRLSTAMQRGELSYSKVRALTRIATPANEAQLLDVAQCSTAAHVEKLVRGWRRIDRTVAAQEAQRRHQSRALHTWVDDDGMLVIRGRLTPEVGAVVQRALDAASDRLFREAPDRPADQPAADQTTSAQRRADALALLAESALAADLDRGTAGDRYQVVLHVEGEALRRASTPPEPVGRTPLDAQPPTDETGQAVLDGGPCVAAETSRRLACDASLVVMRHAPDGAALDVGRKTRTIPPSIRRALSARDAHCRFPGCTGRHTDAHHVEHWADGGATRLDNLVLLCRRHHRAVHEEGWTVTWGPDGDAQFTQPTGVRLDAAPAPPRWRDAPSAPDAPDARSVQFVGDPSPLAPTTARLAIAGVVIGPRTGWPQWYGEPFDTGYVLDVLRQNEPRARRQQEQVWQQSLPRPS